MKIQFDSTQSYQLQAVQSVIDIFEGQPLSQSDFEVSFQTDNIGYSEKGVANILQIDKTQIEENLKKVQFQNEIKNTQILSENITNINIEMETGTGKTYTFLRTIYELNKQYNFKKFVIVVPSVAIREGTLKNLQITHEHFQSLYHSPMVEFVMYDRNHLGKLRNFAISNAIQILVINIDSFTKDNNVINQVRETGIKPIEYIQNVKPIVIIDEPQNFDTDIRKKALENLNPLFALRYSATHKEKYNFVYSLNPVQAYDLGLVKQIQVNGVTSEKDLNNAFVELKKIESAKNTIKAKIAIFVSKDKKIDIKEFLVKTGDDLYDLSGKLEMYKNNYIVQNIHKDNEQISFMNEITLKKGESQGDLREDIQKKQIENTIKYHFETLKKLEDKNIKVLSLFFIDKVSNYRQYDENGNFEKGKFAVWFEEIFKKYQKENKGLINFEVEEVHNGYFSSDKKTGKNKADVWIDSKEKNTQRDDDTYSLIMKDKERLLDIDEPLQFIFSHSALREGWDNPNIFQICTLNESKSELKKRQEIGRGLRLCVDAFGQRIQDKHTNILTVIANESYESFADSLQKEIEEETGMKFEGRIKNATKPKAKIQLNKELTPENYPFFFEIWEKINQETRYVVNFETEKLIKLAVEKIKNMPKTRKPLIKSTLVKIDINEQGVNSEVQEENFSYAKNVKYQIPNIYAYIQSKIELKRKTIFEILKQSEKLDEIIINPQMFLDNVVTYIKQSLQELLVDGIKYQTINGKKYDISLFRNEEIETYLDALHEIKKTEKTIFNYIQIDSGTEKTFAIDCENDENIKFFFKIPKGFKIPTPLGNYIPDWAIIFENDSRIYFVLETKSTLNENDLRNSESLKIQCGKEHFSVFEGISYKHITKVKDLY